MDTKRTYFSRESTDFLGSVDRAEAQEYLYLFDNLPKLMASAKPVAGMPDTVLVRLKRDVRALLVVEKDKVIVLDVFRKTGHRSPTTSFQNANMQRSTLAIANFANTVFRNANLTQANLQSAILTNSDLSHAKLDAANLSYTFCKNADFSHASLQKANFEAAYLVGAQFVGADLTDAYLSRADLALADLSDCKLIRCHMNQIANFEQIKSFKGAVIAEAFDLTPEQREFALRKGALLS